MPHTMTVYNVFIASPSDTQKERNIVSKLIDEWNSLNSELHGITLKSMRWEKDAVPVLGASAQQAINSQLLDNADFLIGIFNKKFGAPTDEYPCATVEEIERHMDSGKPGMLFFCNGKVTRDEAFNNDDLRNIEELKRKYQKKTFYKEYTDTTDFEEKCKFALTRAITMYFIGPQNTVPIPTQQQRRHDFIESQRQRAYELDCVLFSDILKTLSPAFVQLWDEHDMEQYFPYSALQKLRTSALKLAYNANSLHDGEAERARLEMLNALGAFLDATRMTSPAAGMVGMQGVPKEWRDCGDKEMRERHRALVDDLNKKKDLFVEKYNDLIRVGKAKIFF